MVSKADPRGFKYLQAIPMEKVCVGPGLAWEHPARLRSAAGDARLALQPLQRWLCHLQGEEAGGRDVPVPLSGSHLPARGNPALPSLAPSWGMKYPKHGSVRNVNREKNACYYGLEENISGERRGRNESFMADVSTLQIPLGCGKNRVS